VCVDARNRTHDLIARERRFAVNILSEAQEDFSRRYAGDESRAVQPVLNRRAAAKSPVFEGALAWFDCSLWRSYEGGDHTIYVGLVEAFEAAGGRPLLFFAGGYNRLP